MIKIIKDGIIKPNVRIIYNVECDNCKCIFECDITDFKQVPPGITLLPGKSLISCPYCGMDIIINRRNQTHRLEEIKPIHSIPVEVL